MRVKFVLIILAIIFGCSQNDRHIEYYPNGTVKKITFVIEDGKIVEWYDPSGILVEKSEWKNNKIDGHVVRYFNDGRIFYKGLFENGLPIKTNIYDSTTGKIVRSLSLKNNMFQGPFKTYYSTGEIKSEGVYHMNNLEGLVHEYYKNGRVESTTLYKEGVAFYGKKFDTQGVLVNSILPLIISLSGRKELLIQLEYSVLDSTRIVVKYTYDKDSLADEHLDRLRTYRSNDNTIHVPYVPAQDTLYGIVIEVDKKSRRGVGYGTFTYPER